MTPSWPLSSFGQFLRPNKRPHLLGVAEDANLVGMRWYGLGPFHRELKMASNIQKKSHFVIHENDVIYNKLFAWKGSFGVVSAELHGMFVSDKFPTYELDTAIVDPGFLKWYFRYPPLWEQAREMSTGSAALSKLTLNPPRFLDLTIPLPTIDEQRRLVARIERLNAKIEDARALRTSATDEQKALRGSFLREMSMRFSRLGILGTALLSKPRNGWSAKCDNADDGTPVLSLSAVTGFMFDCNAFKRTSLPTDPMAHYWLRPGDLLVSRSNTPELVGHAAIYAGKPTPCIYSDLMMRLDINPDIADTNFVWCWMQTPLVRDFIRRHAKGTSPTMKKISQPVVMGIPFPTDLGIDEQRGVVQKMDMLQQKIDAVDRSQLESSIGLDALLPSILDHVFKGGM